MFCSSLPVLNAITVHRCNVGGIFSDRKCFNKRHLWLGGGISCGRNSELRRIDILRHLMNCFSQSRCIEIQKV